MRHSTLNWLCRPNSSLNQWPDIYTISFNVNNRFITIIYRKERVDWISALFAIFQNFYFILKHKQTYREFVFESILFSPVLQFKCTRRKKIDKLLQQMSLLRNSADISTSVTPRNWDWIVRSWNLQTVAWYETGHRAINYYRISKQTPKK